MTPLWARMPRLPESLRVSVDASYATPPTRKQGQLTAKPNAKPGRSPRSCTLTALDLALRRSGDQGVTQGVPRAAGKNTMGRRRRRPIASPADSLLCQLVSRSFEIFKAMSRKALLRPSPVDVS